MSTKSISTSTAISTCDVCGRTLLRGERAEIYVSGGTRRSVCELCTSRALHGGWVREGTVPSYPANGDRVDRRRSLLSRLRTRRDTASTVADGEFAFGHDEEPSQQPPLEAEPRPVRETRPVREPRHTRESRPTREPRSARESRPVREPRHVRAVPTSIEHKISSAITLFNNSEHPRTVAGIGRSLGLPEAAVVPAAMTPSVVHVVISWELCWYRYEVDLSDEVPTFRVAGQGYELDELGPAERQCNALADDRGQLTLTR